MTGKRELRSTTKANDNTKKPAAPKAKKQTSNKSTKTNRTDEEVVIDENLIVEDGKVESRVESRGPQEGADENAAALENEESETVLSFQEKEVGVHESDGIEDSLETDDEDIDSTEQKSDVDSDDPDYTKADLPKAKAYEDKYVWKSVPRHHKPVDTIEKMFRQLLSKVREDGDFDEFLDHGKVLRIGTMCSGTLESEHQRLSPSLTVRSAHTKS